MSKIKYKETQYGFEFGDVKIQRYFSDELKGWVVVGLETSKKKFQIYVTKTGKVRIFDEKSHTELDLKKRKTKQEKLK